MVLRQKPLSEQVRDHILDWIRSDHSDLMSGTLPSEAELADLFNTSRATVREALAQLERDRIIIRRQGSGTYINPALRKLTNAVNELMDPIRMIELQGYPASIGTVKKRLDRIGLGAGEILGASPEAEAVHLQVLYLAGDQPVIWLEAVIPVDEIPSEGPSLPGFTNLILFASEVSGFTATHSISTIQAINADEMLAEQLGTQVGKSLLQMEDVYLTDYGRPAFFVRLMVISDFLPIQLLRNSYRPPDRISIW